VHSEKYENRAAYTRSVRDVLGSGEGIFGMIDGYPEGVPEASRDRLQGIERRCLEWRWRLRGQEHRLSRIHGDYHPFNIVFDDRSALTLLDSSRGSCGDPADDVTCLAINYVFFAIEKPALWRTAFRELWTRFWRTYLAGSGDRELLGVAAPFLAWRGLVVCNPVWYPHVVVVRARGLFRAMAHRNVGNDQTAPAVPRITVARDLVLHWPAIERRR
jgi:hypothetical protein